MQPRGSQCSDPLFWRATPRATPQPFRAPPGYGRLCTTPPHSFHSIARHCAAHGTELQKSPKTDLSFFQTAIPPPPNADLCQPPPPSCPKRDAKGWACAPTDCHTRLLCHSLCRCVRARACVCARAAGGLGGGYDAFVRTWPDKLVAPILNPSHNRDCLMHSSQGLAVPLGAPDAVRTRNNYGAAILHWPPLT